MDSFDKSGINAANFIPTLCTWSDDCQKESGSRVTERLEAALKKTRAILVSRCGIVERKRMSPLSASRRLEAERCSHSRIEKSTNCSSLATFPAGYPEGTVENPSICLTDQPMTTHGNLAFTCKVIVRFSSCDHQKCLP